VQCPSNCQVPTVCQECNICISGQPSTVCPFVCHLNSVTLLPDLSYLLLVCRIAAICQISIVCQPSIVWQPFMGFYLPDFSYISMLLLASYHLLTVRIVCQLLTFCQMSLVCYCCHLTAIIAPPTVCQFQITCQLAKYPLPICQRPSISNRTFV
jgi:hypothetical protein